MSTPPGLTISKDTEKQKILRETSAALAAMEQYLQSGLSKDDDDLFDYKDAAGDIQGPFNSEQLAKWNKAVRYFSSFFSLPLILPTLNIDIIHFISFSSL
jgi:hypothetical protein